MTVSFIRQIVADGQSPAGCVGDKMQMYALLGLLGVFAVFHSLWHIVHKGSLDDIDGPWQESSEHKTLEVR